MSGAKVKTVKRRRVFYIPGFDPFPARRYRELYRKEGAAQAEILGFDLSVSALKSVRYGWQAEAKFGRSKTTSEIEVLEWSDIVKDSMSAGVFGTYALLFRTAFVYISSGALTDLNRLRRGPVLAALYPIGVLLLQLFFAALFGGLAMYFLPAPWSLLGPLIFIGYLYGSKRIDRKFYAYYLMHDYGFAAKWRGADPPVLKPRLAQFADQISKSLSEDYDEVLVVGHSSGAHLGVQVLAQLFREGRVGPKGPQLSFLSLGQVVPMVSFLPDAQSLRRDLNDLSAQENLCWVDISAPSDPCSFALCDPVKVTGVAPQNQRHPKLLSAAFTRTLAPEKLKKLHKNFFNLHFQYLCAFDVPEHYDYFSVTAGPQTLEARFGKEPSSPSRLTHVANRHKDMAS